jgi:signal transduction histidine kinase/HAMP domain-containing protein
MRRPTLRRRLYAVLFQWFLLLVLAAGGILVFSFSGARQSAVDDRLLLARTIARYLDATISTSIQDLGRLPAEIPELTGAAARLHTFRLRSPFHAATYLLDAHGRPVAADPADTTPLLAGSLESHESVTPLVRKPGGDPRPVVAIVQPFQRDGAAYYLVSEMSLTGSMVSAFLQQLAPDRDMHVAVVDDDGVVIASASPETLYRRLEPTAVYKERIRAHRPWVSEDMPAQFTSVGQARAASLTVMVPLQFAPWGVVVEQGRAAAFAGLYAMRRGFLLGGVALAAVGLLLARALSRSVVSPIQELSREAEAFQAGDLSRPIQAAGDREIAVLAETLDEARQKLASTLAELRTLNEDLEGQVASRTRVIEARYRDLRLLHAVAQLSARERDPDRLLPEILRLVSAHWGFPAAAIITRPPGGPAATYVEPPDVRLSWLEPGAAPPADWVRREIVHQLRVQAELYHPRPPDVDAEVMGALDHGLAISLHDAYLWKQTVAQDQQRQVLVRRLLHATEEERRRLARELHDEISQLLTVIQLSLDRVEVAMPEIEQARTLLTRTQKEIHRIIYDLRPSLLDDLGLAAAMKAYAEDHLVRQGIAVSLEIEEELSAGPEVEITVFRIYQELVTNILRHAEAEHVSVELYARDGTLVLEVEDDGKGFDPGRQSSGAGITGMRERAALVNGSIRFDSEEGMGTHAALEIPSR